MCMADYAYDRAEVYRASICRTRKDRVCDECGRAIKAGEDRQYAFMVYEGRGCTFHTCRHCVVAMDWLAENCGGFLHGGVWKDLEEHIDEYPTLAFPLSRLKVARLRGWMRFDGTGLMAVPAVPPSLEAVGLER